MFLLQRGFNNNDIVKTSFAFIIVTLKQEFECILLKLKRNLFYSDTIEKHFNNQKNVSPL